MNFPKSIEDLLQHASKPWFLQLVCVIFSLLIVWDLVAGMPLLNQLNRQVRAKEIANQSQADELKPSSLLNSPLFGDYVPKNLNDSGVQPSSLNVTVVGVVFDVNEKDSQVILQAPDGKEKFFYVGDTLQDGAMIKRISTEGVLVLHNGVLERLSLPKEELQFKNGQKPLSLGNDD
jgi:general secretion pathway protein C